MARLIYAICFIFIFSFSGFCAEQMKLTDIAGTYRIVFFGSQVLKHEKEKDSALDGIADKFYISNNCKKAQELYPAIINHFWLFFYWKCHFKRLSFTSSRLYSRNDTTFPRITIQNS